MIIHCSRAELPNVLNKYPDNDLISIRSSESKLIPLKHYNRALELETNDSNHWNPLNQHIAKLIVEFIQTKKFETKLIIQTEENSSLTAVIVQLANLLLKQRLYQEELSKLEWDSRSAELLDSAAGLDGKLVKSNDRDT